MEMACAFIVVEVTWVYVFARTTPNCTFQVGIFYVNYSLPIVHLKMSKWLKKMQLPWIHCRFSESYIWNAGAQEFTLKQNAIPK